jgi:hypothetical protein
MVQDEALPPIAENKHISNQSKSRSNTCPVYMYYEVDFESYNYYQQNVNNVTTYVVTLFNVVTQIYAQHNIPLKLSGIKVWDTADSYGTYDRPGGYNPTTQDAQNYLNAFADHLDTTGFTGKIAHLLAIYQTGFGGLAALDQLCGNRPYGLNGIDDSYNGTYPAFSSTIDIMAHELGHNFGSRHTHACVWGNNNDRAIDNCSGIEGGPCNVQNDTTGNSGYIGTIMSYCFPKTLTFNSEVSSLLVNKYQAALSSCINDHYCTLYADTDGDGFGSNSTWNYGDAGKGVFNNRDSDDSNANVHPNMVEDCSNNIDDNGNGIINENTLSLHLDGVDDEINFGNSLGNFGTGDFTIETRIKTTVKDRFILSKRGICNIGNFWNLAITPEGYIRFEMHDGTNSSNFTPTSPIDVADGNWHHIAIIRSTSLISVYIDGVLIGPNAIPSINLNNNVDLTIGSNPCGHRYSGEIDEVRIWDTALPGNLLKDYKDAFLPANTPNLIAYYDFNNTNATGGQDNNGQTVVTDRTGNHNANLNNFALNGSSSNWLGNPSQNNCSSTPVSTNNALNFSNATPQYVGINHSNNLEFSNQISIEFWCNPTSFDTYQTVALKATSSTWSSGFGVYLNNGRVSFFPFGLSSEHVGQTVLPLNQWSHVAATFDGDSSRIYINGNIESTVARTGSIANNYNTLGIGADPVTKADRFNGSIDELRIWNRALSIMEIQDNRNCEIVDATHGLVANYHFNEGIAYGNNTSPAVNSLPDHSGKNNTGTLYDFTLNDSTSNWVASSPTINGNCDVCTLIFVEQPSNHAKCEEDSVQFKIAAFTKNGPINFQWQRRMKGGQNWTSIMGATDSLYKFVAQSGDENYTYRVTLSDAENCNLTSDTITFSIKPDTYAPNVVTKDTTLTFDAMGNASITTDHVLVSSNDDNDCTPSNLLMHSLSQSTFSQSDLANGIGNPCVALTTIAGMVRVAGSDDGTGTAATFNSPRDIAVDTMGNYFVADMRNHVIRKITPAGVVTTFAGMKGVSGWADGNGQNASFRFPTGIAIDTSNNNIYVADAYTIRKITPAGDVTTLAGQGGISGSQDGTGSNATFSFQRSLAMNSQGDLFVINASSVIRKITPAGVVTTVAGSAGIYEHQDGNGANARFNYSIGLTIDKNDNIYVADFRNQVIRKITPSYDVTTIAGQVGVSGTKSGNGTNALFSSPSGITVDTDGVIYVGDQGGTIRKITPSGEVTTLIGNSSDNSSKDGTGATATLNGPFGLELDRQGNLVFPDVGENVVRKVEFLDTNCISTTLTVIDTSGKASSAVANIYLEAMPCDLAITTQPTNQMICEGNDVTFSVAATSSEGGLNYQWQKKCESNMVNAWTVYNPSTANPSGFPSFNTRAFKEADGVLYAATNQGLAILENGASSWTVHNASSGNGFPSNDVRDVFISNGIIYAATYGGGLATLDKANGATSWTVYNTSTMAPSGFHENNILSVYVSNGTIYVGGNLYGIAILEPNATNWTVYNRFNGNPSGFPGFSVSSIYKNNGLLYVGTSGGIGTLDIENGATTWTVYNTSTSTPSGFPSDDVRSVFVSDGIIYAATYTTGIATLDIGNAATAWTVYNTSTSMPSGFPNDRTYSVFESKGIIYVGTYTGGIATLDIGNNATTWILNDNTTTNPSGFPSSWVIDIYEKNGTLYSATQGGVATLNLASYTDITGANNVNYSFTPQANDENCSYRVIITDEDNCEITSDMVSFSLNTPENCCNLAISIAGDTAICPGEDAKLTANVSGGTGSCNIQWQQSTDGTTFTDLPSNDTCSEKTAHIEQLLRTSFYTDANSIYASAGQSFTIPNQVSSIDGITAHFGNIIANTTVTLNLYNGPASGNIGTPIATATYTNSGAAITAPSGGDIPIDFTFDAPVNVTPGNVYYYLLSPSVNPTAFSYAFRSGNPYAGGSALSGYANGTVGTWTYDLKFSLFSCNRPLNDTLNITGLTESTFYRAIYNCGVSECEVISDTLHLSYNASGNCCSIATQPTNQTVCTDQDVTFSVTASTGTVSSYQWESNADVNLGNTNNPTLVIPAALAPDIENSDFWVIITYANGCQVTSNSVSFTIDNSSNCNAGNCAPNDLMLNDNPIAENTYRTSMSITSSGTVAANTNVIFKATQSITLQSGFHAVAGSNFTAMIEACQATLVESETLARTKGQLDHPITKATSAVPSVKVFPNPTAYHANINLTLPEMEEIQLDLFDLSGKRIANLVSTVTLPAGNHHFRWECKQVEAGMYLVVLNGRVVSRLAVVR